MSNQEAAAEGCIGSNYSQVSRSQSESVDVDHLNQPSNTTEARSVVKRKPMKVRSKVWEHFEKIKDENGEVSTAKCNYCDRLFACHPKRNGTSSLNGHMNACIKNPHNEQARQALLNLQPNNQESGRVGMLGTWKFDYDEIRQAVAYMIIVDELPFKFVEGKGFQKLMSKACPRFKIPSRWAVTRDCYQLYVDERTKLKSFMKSSCQRVSLTTDTWTSCQRINYMCVTAHFIDNEWNLHKRILNFVPISSHKGDYIGKSIETCVLDWGLKNIFTITVDNASSNDTAIAFLKKRMLNWGESVANCKYLHMRCIAHVVNLVVSDGLKEVNPSVKRVRDAVRYIRSSPARLRKFKEFVEWEGVESKSSLCLDVSTRWNSTYLMLKTAEKFEKVFEKYELEESCFVSDLGRDGVPTSYDWSCVRKLANLLKHFYEMTLRISGSLYVTSNSFFSEISDLCCILNDWKSSDDLLVRDLGDSMKAKFDKYWGDPEKMNPLIFWATVFDPRDKLEYMEYSLHAMYGIEVGEKMYQTVKDGLSELFKEYKQKYESKNDATCGDNSGSLSSTSSGNVRDCDTICTKPGFLKAKFKKQKMEMGHGGNKKTELDVYLNEDIVEDAENLNVLKWWKINSERFPILSRMARDMLVVPISTVASESAFSTGGRVLDVFRSSLTPKLVEALICTQDWLRGSELRICVEEQLEELENFEKELPTVGIGSSLSNTKN